MRQRYVQIDGQLIDVTDGGFVPEVRQTSFQVMPDIKPYQSMVTGEIVNSRSRHRDMLREHGCVEVGNDSSLFREPRPNMKSPPGLKDALIRAANETLTERRS